MLHTMKFLFLNCILLIKVTKSIGISAFCLNIILSIGGSGGRVKLSIFNYKCMKNIYRIKKPAVAYSPPAPRDRGIWVQGKRTKI